MNDPSGSVVGAGADLVVLAAETAGHEIIAAGHLAAAAFAAGLGATAHLEGTALGAAGAGSGFHHGGDASYHQAHQHLVAAGQHAQQALDTLFGPSTTTTDVGVPHGEHPHPHHPTD